MIIQNQCLTFENEWIRREITFCNGRPECSVLIRKASGYRWETEVGYPILELPDFDWEHVRTTFDHHILLFESNYTVRWVIEAAETVPAIRTQIFVRGKAPAVSGFEQLPDLSPDRIGDDAEAAPDKERTECVAHKGCHLHLHAVAFYDGTDSCDSLVRESDAALYHTEAGFTGNLFFAKDPAAEECCVLLKESPVAAAHLNKKTEDLFASYWGLSVCGSGIDYTTLPEDHFVPGYPVTTALCVPGEEAHMARRMYAEACGGFSPYIMSNTWGDRNRDSRISETFLHGEIDRAAELGVDIVQIDDGWQTGRTANSALEKNNVWNGGFYDVNPDFWVPDPEKFPSGFGALCSYAYAHRVALGLWFSPDCTDQYRNWRRDADTLLGFYRTYGIRHFKLDGIMIQDKQSEINLMRFCGHLLVESEGHITFNMDITAGKRLGYFYGKEFGTLFVENRYTDFGSYYPHNTLRNLWQLSRYIPAQKLMFEVLNLRRNPQNYTGDVLAPGGYDMDYVFASVMVSTPLLWMEMQSLASGDQEKLRAVIEIYKLYREDFAEVIPVGACPDGFSVTGFEIRGYRHNYYIGLRENAEQAIVKAPVERMLCTNDPELTYDGDRVIFSSKRRYFFAILRDTGVSHMNERNFE